MRSIFNLFSLFIMLSSCSPTPENKTSKATIGSSYSEIYEGDIDLIDSIENKENKLVKLGAVCVQYERTFSSRL